MTSDRARCISPGQGHGISSGVSVGAALMSREGCGRKSRQVVVEEDGVCSRREPGRGEWLLVYFGGGVGEAVCTRSYFLAGVHMHFPLNRS